jgi:hypothetical protein
MYAVRAGVTPALVWFVSTRFATAQTCGPYALEDCRPFSLVAGAGIPGLVLLFAFVGWMVWKRRSRWSK